MFSSSVIEILRTFSPEELKRFDDFVSSPYFNKKTAVINLYKQIKKYAPAFDNPKLKKELLWKALYGAKAYNYGLFKNLVYDLTRLCENFLMNEYASKDSFNMYYGYLYYLFQKEIGNLFLTKFHALFKKVRQLEMNREIDVKDKHEILSKIYLLKCHYSDQFDRHPRMGEEFNQHSINSASLFLFSLLETCINALNLTSKNFYNKEVNPIVQFVNKAAAEGLISELLDSVKAHSTDTYDVLRTYYKYYLSLSNNSSLEKYFDFKKTLTNLADNFSRTDKFNLYSGLRVSFNVLVSPHINRTQEFIDIRKMMMKNDVVLNPNGLMDEISFVSEIQTACSIGDHEFIKQFSDKYVDHLPKAQRENLRKYALAHLYFAQNEFDKSLEQTLTINYNLLGVKFYLRNLQMMIHYEKNDYNSFLLLIDSFKHFLSKNKYITKDWKETQTLLIKFFNRLFSLKEKYNEFELKALKEEVNSSMVLKKQWLLKKIDDLDKEHKPVLS